MIVKLVKRNRWTLEHKEPCSLYCFKKMKINFKKQELKIQVLEIEDNDNFNSWLSSMNLINESLILKTYDEYGNEIYQFDFKSFNILNDKIKFDYSVGKNCIRKVKLKYKYCNRKLLTNNKKVEGKDGDYCEIATEERDNEFKS